MSKISSVSLKVFLPGVWVYRGIRSTQGLAGMCVTERGRDGRVRREEEHYQGSHLNFQLGRLLEREVTASADRGKVGGDGCRTQVSFGID